MTNVHNDVEITLSGANGPKVVAPKDVDAAQIEAALPAGWTVGENWSLGVDVGGGRIAFPLVQATTNVQITDSQIRTLRDKAGEAGDYATAVVCEFALTGSWDEEMLATLDKQQAHDLEALDLDHAGDPRAAARELVGKWLADGASR